MTYAQRCKACKEVFVLPERVENCPSCAAAMPVKKPKTKPQDSSSCVDALDDKYQKHALTWREWKNLEPGLHKDEKLPIEQPAKVTESANNDVIAEFLTINEEIASLYNLLYGFMSKNTELIKSLRYSKRDNGASASGMSNEAMCDFGFFCREAENTLDELRKEVKARKELCGQTIAIRKTQDSLSDPNIKLKVTGQYATGSPDVKMQAQLPKKFTDEYYQITDFLKVPREVAATGVLRLDWKATGEFITQLANDGHKPPAGFGKQYPTYVTTFRRRRKV